MDDTEKAKLRKRAAWLHWSVQALFVLIILVAFFPQAVSKRYAGAWADMQLTRPSSLLLNQFSQWYFSRSKELTALPLPSDTSLYPAWAQQVQSFLGQPAAVFVRDNKGIHWVMQPDGFAPGVPRVLAVFSQDTSDEKSSAKSVYGSYEIQRTSWKTGVGYKVLTLTRQGSDKTWGVLIRWTDCWKSFFNQLKLKGNHATPGDGVVWTLHDQIQLDSTKSNLAYGMRVFMDGEVIFASPLLDTTRLVYKSDLKDLYVEFYQSREDQLTEELLRSGFVRWLGFVLPLVMMLVLFINYLWFRRLTEPES